MRSVSSSRAKTRGEGYLHPAAEEKRQAMQKFEKFRAEGIIGTAATIQSHGVPTKVTTLERVRNVFILNSALFPIRPDDVRLTANHGPLGGRLSLDRRTFLRLSSP
jgi:hypothetical protein